MLEGKRLIRTIRLRNILSFGPSAERIELGPLNVLIGPNASGKSNLIEAISLLQAAPRDLLAPIRQGGGVSEWLWKGPGATPEAEIDATVEYAPQPGESSPLRHRLSFTMVGQRFELTDEAIEDERKDADGHPDVRFYYRFRRGRPVLLGPVETVGGKRERHARQLKREDLAPDQSVLSQRRDPDQYPEITCLAEQYSKIRLYREWNLGRYTAPRLPQKADLPSDFLDEDASNLGLVLNDLEHAGLRDALREKLREFYPAITDVATKVAGGTVQIFVHEEGMKPIPATRLSDGTLRYLCLLSILCHPSPPPLICIEEPELGLHPDILPTVAELLVDASQRTQLIVTTHSEALVDALTDEPDAVVVCERDSGGSTCMQRLEPERLRAWLERYSLGQLWRKGEIGGNRY